MTKPRSQREVRLARETRLAVDASFTNFGDGLAQLFNRTIDRNDAADKSVRVMFAKAYPLFEWCRIWPRRARAIHYLQEGRASLVLATAFCAAGLYEVSYLQLRYACECILGLLYFEDHPRELELAEMGNDMWEQSRASAVLKFLRQLPEYSGAAAKVALGDIERLYRDLSSHVHPRQRSHMSGDRYLVAPIRDATSASAIANVSGQLCGAAVSLLWLANPTLYDRAGEVSQYILLSGLNRQRRLALAREVPR